MDDKILKLAKKLHALAERGVDGEKQNAIAALEAFMNKHGISVEDICGEKKTSRVFKITNREQKFFFQVVASVIGHFTYSRWKGSKDIEIELTDADFIEISTKYDFYLKAYNEDLQLFYSAFIQKNKLYRKKGDDEKPEEKELSPEEKEHIWKLSLMMEGIEQRTHLKRLKD